MKHAFILALFTAGLLFPRPAAAWHDPGHMLMARLVYEQLKPEARKKYVELLKTHPRYREDLLAGMPPDFPDPDLYAWMKAGTWPDLIRDKAHPANLAHHQPTWHYVNYAFVPDPEDRARIKPPEPSEEGTAVDDVLQALRHNQAILNDAGRPAADRAVALCWMLHLVADIHQPMHATTLFSRRFPEGDRGGNEFLVKVDGEVQRLHIYWDLLFGTNATPEAIQVWHELLSHDPSCRREAFTEALQRSAWRQWADESHALGAAIAYQGGKLDGVVRREYEADKTIPVPALPLGYETVARAVALKRIALAAFRLADRLNAE